MGRDRFPIHLGTVLKRLLNDLQPDLALLEIEPAALRPIIMPQGLVERDTNAPALFDEEGARIQT